MTILTLSSAPYWRREDKGRKTEEGITMKKLVAEVKGNGLITTLHNLVVPLSL